ncbi:MAG: hypothetical protein ACP5HQ_02505 [Thermoprotei archaeon]
MICSSQEIHELKGLNFMVPNCDKQYVLSRINEVRDRAVKASRIHILRVLETNYFRFELLILQDGSPLLSISTVRGTNNINLRNLDMVKELADLTCCFSSKQDVMEKVKSYLGEARAGEAEVVDFEEKDAKVEFEPACDKVTFNEYREPEVKEGSSWATSELAASENLYVKLLGGPAKFVSISTERPQNSIKFGNADRLRSLCCFAALVWSKLSECKGLYDALKELEAMAATPKKRRK